VPTPESTTFWGEPGALSVNCRFAASDPPAVGVKTTETAQFAPGFTLLPQLLVCVKSLESVPLMAMPEIESAALPVLVRVTVRAG